MANVIKHKRGSGSDPAANNLVIGELAIRTDTGKLFTKMDSGAIAEIAGGGSDIAINTLSSSSGTGGGSATFNGSAYRFTLSAPPSVSAAQLLVSINGVIQKPVTGTGQPSEGFAVDGNDIILGDAPETGSDFFILTFKSLGVSEPADNSVTSAKIVDGAIVNADINASAAIAGSKIAPDFGSQNIVTTGSISGATGTLTGDLTIPDTIVHTGDTNTKIRFPATDTVSVETAGSERIRVASNGDIGINTTTINRRDAGRNTIQFDYSGSDASEGVELRLSNSAINGNASTDNLQITYTGQNFAINNTENGNIQIFNNGSERMRIDSSGNVSIGTTTTISNQRLKVNGNVVVDSGTVRCSDGFSSDTDLILNADANNDSSNSIIFKESGTETARIDPSGRVGIGTSSPNVSGFNSDANVLTLSGPKRGFIELRGDTQAADSIGGIRFFSANNLEAEILSVTDGSYNGDLRFNTNGSERMRIDSSGKVGIGTTSPSAHLGVEGDGNECLRLKNTTGIINRIIFQDNASRQAEIIMHTGHLQFSPNSGGSIRFQLNENGQGNHNYTTNCNPKEIYNWSNNKTGMSFRSASTERGNIYFFDSGVQFNTSSDYRLKENVTSISDGITRIKQLIPRKFNWIIDESNTPVDGFLAHEVSSIVPEAVNGTKDAVATQEDVDSGRSQKVGDPIHQMIDHSKLVPLLTAALQEAIGRIEALEAK